MNETWSGTVLVTGDILVPPWVTLTILPGTRVTFAAQTDDQHAGGDTDAAEYSIFPRDPPLIRNNLVAITVFGTLRAVGTPQSRIVFTSAAARPTDHDWETVRVEGSGIIEYATVEWAYLGIGVGPRTGPVAIRNSIIQDIAACAICTGQGTRFTHLVTVTDNLIQRARHEGIAAFEEQAWLVERNTFKDNFVGLVCEGCQMSLSGNLFTGNDRGFVALSGGTLTATANRVTGSKGEAVSTYGAGSTLVLRRNSIVGNGLAANIGSDTRLDAPQNWWGTTDSQEVLLRFLRATGAVVTIEPLLLSDPLP